MKTVHLREDMVFRSNVTVLSH